MKAKAVVLLVGVTLLVLAARVSASANETNVERFRIAPAPPSVEQSKTFSVSPCDACKALVKDVAAAAMKIRANDYGIVVLGQTFCQQKTLSPLFKVDCKTFADVQRWFLKGGLIAKASSLKFKTGVNASLVDLKALESNPATFCDAVKQCGAGKSTDAVPDAGAVIVRFRFQVNLERMPRSSKRWKLFVRNFIREVALAVDAQPSRFELHIHQHDHKQAELIILKTGKAEDVDMGKGRGRSAYEIARQLQTLIRSHDVRIGVPNQATALIDPTYEVQLYNAQNPLYTYSKNVGKQ